eukprot:TRINITY_DN34432_c0_g1_i1.p1 TRINITY_DN34432_c0_g1~~TRINITY_DN34432_c0_g1_i1.p1  ORF type:complete len:124 (-),score=36.89 TRINITY_DN34432_c0_g1_i1:71-442(-)
MPRCFQLIFIGLALPLLFVDVRAVEEDEAVDDSGDDSMPSFSEALQHVDKDKDGKMSTEEVFAEMSAEDNEDELGAAMLDKFKAAVKESDANSNGFIEEEEFAKLVQTLQEIDPEDPAAKEEV